MPKSEAGDWFYKPQASVFIILHSSFFIIHSGDVPITFADVGKAKERLEYDPQVGIEEGVERFVAWWRRQNGM